MLTNENDSMIIEEDQLENEYNKGFQAGFIAGLRAAKEAIIAIEERE